MHLETGPQFQLQRRQQGLAQGRRIPGIFGQKAFPTGQMAIHEKTSMRHLAHRLASAGQQQAHYIAAEIDETRFIKVRSEQH
jgi:hypothetical protein